MVKKSWPLVWQKFLNPPLFPPTLPEREMVRWSEGSWSDLKRRYFRCAIFIFAADFCHHRLKQTESPKKWGWAQIPPNPHQEGLKRVMASTRRHVRSGLPRRWQSHRHRHPHIHTHTLSLSFSLSLSLSLSPCVCMCVYVYVCVPTAVFFRPESRLAVSRCNKSRCSLL